jgi:hypothetical protein
MYRLVCSKSCKVVPCEALVEAEGERQARELAEGLLCDPEEADCEEVKA